MWSIFTNFLFTVKNFCLFYVETHMSKDISKKCTLVSTRCNVDVAMQFFHLEVLPKLNKDQLTVLSSTPFMHLFAFPRNTQSNNALLHHILCRWNEKKGCFVFKKHNVYFTVDEVALLLGLSSKGMIHEWSKLIKNVNMFFWYFIFKSFCCLCRYICCTTSAKTWYSEGSIESKVLQWCNECLPKTVRKNYIGFHR